MHADPTQIVQSHSATPPIVVPLLAWPYPSSFMPVDPGFCRHLFIFSFVCEIRMFDFIQYTGNGMDGCYLGQADAVIVFYRPMESNVFLKIGGSGTRLYS